MRVIQFLFCCFPLLGVSFECAMVLAQTPLLEDVVAGYRTNASFFHSSRVYYEFREEEETIIYEDQQIHDKESIIKDTSVIKSQELKSQKFAYDYWTDFNNILLRGGNAKDIDAVGLFANQKTDLLSSDFETLYRSIPVSSYSARDKIVYKWIGYPSSLPANSNHTEQASARIETDVVSIYDKNFRPPPFLASSLDEEELDVYKAAFLAEVFLADYFFAGSLKDKSIIGTVNREGKDYIVMESRKLNTSTVDRTPLRGVFYQVLTGWIDMEQGFLPVRIQTGQAYYVNGKFDGGYTSSLQYPEKSLFEIQEIKKIGNAFYPTAASVRSGGYSISVTPEQIVKIDNKPVKIVKPIIEIDNDANNKVNEPDEKNRDVSKTVSPSKFNNVKKWVVHRVQPDVVFNNDTLTLQFPKGTEVYDTRTQKYGIAGMTDAEYEAQIKAEEQKSRAKYNFDSGYVLPDPNAKRKIEDYIPRAPVGYRSAFFIIGVNLIVLSLLARYFFRCWKEYKNNKNNKNNQK
jgi:hypothetical protein